MVFAGMPGLHRLLYFSRTALSGLDLDLELGRIVRDSIHNNRQAAVTGMLLSHDGWFVQVLEGPGEAVSSTFRRIQTDRRHSDATRVSWGPVPSRLFADWDMCARSLNDGDDDILTDIGRFDPRGLASDQLLRLLSSVADQQRAVLAA